jgi:cytidyltransferase-like protein
MAGGLNMEPELIVLGRFQPFHKGHAAMVSAALSHLKANNSKAPLRICIGSSEAEPSIDNPWTVEERELMIRTWIDNENVDFVHIPDINDPPNYVKHAEKYHGKIGKIFTSDEKIRSLYIDAGWKAVDMPFENRINWQGWRVRATIQMMSTITDEEAVRTVLSENIPENVVNWLLENDAIKRLAFMGRGGEPVG